MVGLAATIAPRLIESSFSSNYKQGENSKDLIENVLRVLKVGSPKDSFQTPETVFQSEDEETQNREVPLIFQSSI